MCCPFTRSPGADRAIAGRSAPKRQRSSRRAWPFSGNWAAMGDDAISDTARPGPAGTRPEDEPTVRALREELLALLPKTRARAVVWLHAPGASAPGAGGLRRRPLPLRGRAGAAAAGSDTSLIPWALLEVGHAAWLQGEGAVTQSHALAALALFQEMEDTPGMLAVLESLAVAAWRRDGRRRRRD